MPPPAPTSAVTARAGLSPVAPPRVPSSDATARHSVAAAAAAAAALVAP